MKHIIILILLSVSLKVMSQTEVQQASAFENLSFGTIEFKDDTAVIYGFIENYDTSIIRDVQFQHFNPLGPVTVKSTDFPITRDGRFTIKTRMFNPQMMYLSYAQGMYPLFAEPGDTSFITIRIPGSIPAISYKGKYADLSNELLILLEHYDKISKENIIDIMRKESTNAAVLKRYKELFVFHCHSIDSLISANRFSEESAEVFHKVMNFYHVMDLGIVQRYRSPLGRKFIDGMNLKLNDNISDCIAFNYFLYLNILNNLYYFEPLVSGNVVMERRAAFLIETVTDSTDLKAVNDWRAEYNNFVWPVLNDTVNYDKPGYDSLALDEFTKYSGLNKLISKYWNSLPDSMAVNLFIALLDKKMADFGRSETAEMLCTYSIRLKQLTDPVDDKILQWADQNITNPIILKVIHEGQVLRNDIDESVVTTVNNRDIHIIDTLPASVNDEDVFTRLISQFRGKVIYIDVWADWCSPCRAQFPYAEYIKKQFKDDDIIFLSLGYRCKHDNWQKVIYKSNVTGYHYWLNDADSDYLSKRFSISGIPFFILVSKNGEIITKDVPWPSSDKIKDTLNDLLKMTNMVN